MSYLTFEEYRMLWDLVSRKPFLTGFPLHLDVELTSRCNLKCKMCFQQHIEEKREDMSEQVFQKIVNEGVQEGLCSMKLQSRGESLLHKRLLDFLAYSKKAGIIDVHITTNGLLLTEKIIKGVVGNDLDMLIISYDDAHSEAASMRKSEYTAFMQDVVKKVDKCRKLYKKGRPKIRIQTCIQEYLPENIEKEEQRNRELFPEVDTILINPIYESYEDDPHLSNIEEYDFYPCSYLWQRLTIYADGSVTTCSRDYNCKFNRIGNVNESSVKELWYSSVLRDMRKRHLVGRRKDFHICAVCENYLINKKTGLPGAGCTGVVYKTKSPADSLSD